MSTRATDVPNAWDDDDWVSQADKSASSAAPPTQPAPLNKQERLQQHAEANRKLWESADAAETFHYIEANSGGAPLSAVPFKPQVKVLSRKPVAAKGGADKGNDADDDDDLKRGGAQLLTPDEIRAKQKRERDEKQRRYDEARAKIFGESAPSSRGSSPGAGAVTPPRSDARGGASSARGRGRGTGYRGNNNTNFSNHSNFSNGSGSGNISFNGGGGGGNGGNGGFNNFNAPGNHYFESRRPNNPSGQTRELYDPNSSPKPDSIGRGRGTSSGDNSPRVQTPRTDYYQQQVLQQQQFSQQQFSQQQFPQYQFSQQQQFSQQPFSQQQFPQQQFPQQQFSQQQSSQQQFSQQQFSQQQFPQQQFPQHHQAIRSPRGPDSSGRGGFGLARRGLRGP